MNELLTRAGIVPDKAEDSIDMSALLRPPKDLIRAFPDQMDPDGVDEIFFNDNIQLHIWYSKEDSRLRKFLVCREPIDIEKNDTAEVIIDWESGKDSMSEIEPWKLRWAIAQIERGSGRTMLSMETKNEIESIIKGAISRIDKPNRT